MADKDLTKQNRRDFLKTGALAASAFMIVPRHVLGGNGFIAPSDKLIIAGIGVGGKGQSDLASHYKSGNAEIAFLCDVDDRRSAQTRKTFPKAKYYKDYREMMDKESKNFDAVSVASPDHNHAVQAMAAMQLGKHVYVQKPLTHDIYEARMLTEAAVKYKLVTQMGNQGASGDGIRQMMDWYKAGVIGDVTEVYCWTDRPVWPQGIPWSTTKAQIPAELDWDLWLGTAPKKDFVEKLVPFNWRGWWDYGTGALGDMACHLMMAPFQVMELQYPTEAECSVGSVYVDEFKRGYFPESCPPSSHTTLNYKGKAGKPDVKMHWMDGGIQPERPQELGASDVFGDGGNGVLMIGTKGKMTCGTYARDPKLLMPNGENKVKVPETIARVKGGEDGHYAQWVNAAIAGYNSKEAKALSSPFSIAGPMTEAVLMGNLAIRSFDIKEGNKFPGRYIKLLWDGPNMKITNFDQANQFVKRQYREGYSLGV